MKHSKSFYKDLPHHNGYKWSYYSKGLHTFTKQISGGMHNGKYEAINLSDINIECPKSFKLMLDKELSETL